MPRKSVKKFRNHEKYVGAHIPGKHHRLLTALAKEEDRTVSSIIRQLVLKKLKSVGAIDGKTKFSN